MSQIIITIPQFKTHANKSANKFVKLNGNAIYSGSMHRFTRAKVVNELHEYFGTYLAPFKGLNLKGPLKITLRIYTVLNHGSISMRKGILTWKPVKPGYIPNWDIENLYSLYSKVINDTLTIENVIEDDNVKVVTCLSCEFIEVKNIADRKIEILIDY